MPIAAEVLRVIALLAVPFVLLPWATFDADVAIGLAQFGLLMVGSALLAVLVIVTSVAIWNHWLDRRERARFTLDGLDPPPLPPASAGRLAPLKPGPVLAAGNAKALPTEADEDVA